MAILFPFVSPYSVHDHLGMCIWLLDHQKFQIDTDSLESAYPGHRMSLHPSGRMSSVWGWLESFLQGFPGKSSTSSMNLHLQPEISIGFSNSSIQPAVRNIM